jgi:protein disulfide-isomerase A6
MNKLFQVVVLVSLLLTVISATEDVVSLTSKTFDKEVLKTNVPYFVKFFAPWCGHCKRLAPTWDQLGTNMKGIVNVGKVDCTVEQSLCAQYKVEGYPTLKLFLPGGKVVPYNGDRSPRAMADFAIENLQSTVSKVTTVDALNTFLEKSADLPHVLLFTSKATTPPVLKSLSMRFKKEFVFGEINQKNKEVVDQYKVDAFPTLLLVPSAGAEPVRYEGAIKPEALIEFLNQYVPASSKSSSTEAPKKPQQTNTESTGSTASEGTKTNPIQVTKKVKNIEEVTKDNVETFCAKTICVIGLLDVQLSEENKPSRNDYVDAEQMKVYKALATKFHNDPFEFVWVDRNQAQSFLDKFEISDNSKPNVVVYYAKRSKFVLVDNFSEEAISNTLDRVISGDAPYKRLKKDE